LVENQIPGERFNPLSSLLVGAMINPMLKKFITGPNTLLTASVIKVNSTVWRLFQPRDLEPITFKKRLINQKIDYEKTLNQQNFRSTSLENTPDIHTALPEFSKQSLLC
jgi:hypothetical protein